MKIQCACGTKYSFDITPEMARTPIRFVCQKCGRDSSEAVNQLIRQELSTAAPAPTASTPSAPVPPPASLVPQPPAVSTSGLRLEKTSPAPPSPPPVAAPTTPASRKPPPVRASAPRMAAPPAPAAKTSEPPATNQKMCAKHAGQVATHCCLICHKPICPKCMELFGFVCSAFCKGKAEEQRINLPVYAGQKSVVESRRWKKIGLVASAAAVVVLALLGTWAWYAWVGSVPKPVFAVRLNEPGYSGQSRLLPGEQLVFLHGGTLARYDLKAKKEVWSRLLVESKPIASEAAGALKQMEKSREEAISNGADRDAWRLPTLDELTAQMERAAAAVLELHVRGQNIWVASPGKLTHYNWESGNPIGEVPLSQAFARLIPEGDELLLMGESSSGGASVTRINLVSGEAHQEDVAPPEPAFAGRIPAGRRVTAVPVLARAGSTAGKPLDPSAIAARAQNLPLPAKLALPAVVAANANQQRLMAEMRGAPAAPPGAPTDAPPIGIENASLLPSTAGLVQFSVTLLESKSVARQAMKARPKKSALDGEVNAAATTAIANEILNDIQRDRVGSIVYDDVSRYRVTLRRPGQKAPDWTGEVIGPPQLFPLKTVDVLAAGKTMLVFDKANKKLWESKLNFEVREGFGELDFDSPYGQGPCVEHGESLYVFDQGVLTAFDRQSGNVRWRLPSVGVAGVFFDGDGSIYVNTTSASPESLKYSRQIDISEKTRQIILKVDEQTGRTLWKCEQEGMVSYVSGKFLYTVESYFGDDDEGLLPKTGFEIPPHIRIKRINPRNGRVLWEHYQKRAPLDVQFDQNTIELLFKRELQVLKFISL